MLKDSLGNPVTSERIYMDSKYLLEAHNFIIVPKPQVIGRVTGIYFSTSSGMRREGLLPLESEPVLYPISREALSQRAKEIKTELQSLESAIQSNISVTASPFGSS